MTFLSNFVTAIVVGLMLQSTGSAVDWSELNSLTELSSAVTATEAPLSIDTALTTAPPIETAASAIQSAQAALPDATASAELDAVPTAIPTEAAWPAWLTSSQARNDVTKLVAAIYVSFDGSTEYKQHEYIVDNVQTHLLARWVEFKRAQIANDPSLRIESMALVKPGEPQLHIDGNSATCITNCDLSYIYAGSDSTEQLQLTFTIEYTYADDTTGITKIDMAGEQSYEDLRSAALAEGNGELTIEAIDKVADAAIAALGN